MTLGTLVPVALPWMISPSGSEFSLRWQEDGDAVIRTAASLLDEAASAHVGLRFIDCGWVRAQPPFSDPEVLPPDFDVAWTLALEPIDTYLERLGEAWRSSGLCSNSGVFEVQESKWIAGDALARRSGVRHFVLKGHDAWIEILCRGFEWAFEATES